MWTIKATAKKLDINIQLSSLFHTITTYQGILLFSSKIPRGKNIAGFNPLIRVKEKSLQYHTTTEHINNPFKIIDLVISHGSKTVCPEGAAAGFLGYIAYDYKNRLEEANLYTNPRQGLLPDLYFVLFEHYLIFHTGNRKATLITLQPEFHYTSVKAGQILDLVSKPVEMSCNNKKSSYVKTSLPKKEYENAVKKTIHYIRAGDIYQANITRAIYGRTAFTPEDLGVRL
jgi:anthranilate/para-aminobenzoate synthase component I